MLSEHHPAVQAESESVLQVHPTVSTATLWFTCTRVEAEITQQALAYE